MLVAPAMGSFASRMILRLWRATKKGERRSGSHKRLLYCVNVNRTSLDHLLLDVVADIDKVSHAGRIAPLQKRKMGYWAALRCRPACSQSLVVTVLRAFSPALPIPATER